MAQEPDFLYCTQCESPVYTFEWNYTEGRVASALCGECGNEESGDFQTEEQFSGED